MPIKLRIATFNLENLDDKPGEKPTLDERIALMRPQLLRLNADILRLREVNGQVEPGRPRHLLALEKLLADTPYAGYHKVSTMTEDGTQVYLDNTRALDIINIYRKSRLPTDIPGQKVDNDTWKTSSGWAEGFFIPSMKRIGQALETRMLVDKLFDVDEDALMVVWGDFNANLDEVPGGRRFEATSRTLAMTSWLSASSSPVSGPFPNPLGSHCCTMVKGGRSTTCWHPDPF